MHLAERAGCPPTLRAFGPTFRLRRTVARSLSPAAEPLDAFSGEGGIRTRGWLLTSARLASGYLRPLGHLSLSGRRKLAGSPPRRKVRGKRPGKGPGTPFW